MGSIRRDLIARGRRFDMRTSGVLALLTCLVTTSLACIGTGCLHDKMENRFFWISIHEDPNSIKDIGSPRDYCTTFGLSLTQPGSSLWMRAEKLEKDKWSGTIEVSKEKKVICHEPKWS